MRLEDKAEGMDKGVTLSDRVESAESGQMAEKLLILQDALGRLKTKDRRALNLHIAGYTQIEIAARMSTSQPTIHRSLLASRKLILAACAG